MNNSADKKRFYVLRVMSGKESRVKEMLDVEKESGNSSLRGRVFNVYVPSEKVMIQRGAKKKVVERPSMPGYILVEAILDNDLIHILRNLPDIVGFLGGGNPDPLAEYEVERLMRRQDNQDEDSIEMIFVVGETVKVTDGAFTGFTATIEEIYAEKKKLKVMVKIFGRKTPLELGYNQVEKE